MKNWKDLRKQIQSGKKKQTLIVILQESEPKKHLSENINCKYKREAKSTLRERREKLSEPLRFFFVLRKYKDEEVRLSDLGGAVFIVGDYRLNDQFRLKMTANGIMTRFYDGLSNLSCPAPHVSILRFFPVHFLSFFFFFFFWAE